MDGKRAFEDSAEDAFLPPGLTGGELAVGVEAGQLSTGAGAAGRAIESRAGAENEVATGVGGVLGGAGELDVIDEGTVFAADAVGFERAAHRIGGSSESGAVFCA